MLRRAAMQALTEETARAAVAVETTAALLPEEAWALAAQFGKGYVDP